MTVIRPNSISGINSITANGGDINLFRADGTAGDLTINNIVGAAATFTGVVTYEDVTNVDSIGIITARSGIDASSNLLLKTGGTERLRITSAGSVGINSTSPDRRFTIHQDATCRMNLKSLANSTAGIEFGDEADHNAGYVVYDNTDNSFQVGLNGTGEKLRITSTGQMGLGGTPTHKLEIFNAADTENILMIRGADATTEYAAMGVSGGNAVITGGGVGSTSAGISFRTAASGSEAERLRIKSNGNIGINETNPQRYLHITGNDGTTGASSGNSDTQLIIENAGGNGAMIEFLSSNTGAGRIFFTDSDASNRGGIEYFHSSDHFQVSAATSNQGLMALHLRKQNAASNVQSDMIAFDVGGSGRGKIVSASSGSGNPQFSAYSDRRLKTNIRDYTGGYDRIKSIPVQLYDEVLNDQTKSVFGDNVKTDVIGWIADEVQSVFPDAVMGTKGEVDSDGKPVYQRLTEGTFLPDAIQAIQKLIQKVETLEAEVAALKGS